MSNWDRIQPLALTISGSAVLAGAALFGVFAASKRSPAPSRKILQSPLETLLPQLSQDQVSRLAYPPDILPGARDVDTPYGSMRVYEWGSETGRKVLFVHGDATPSPMFMPIAHSLVSKGCRVMMFDLWGRGYSDTPMDCPHDALLYSQQMYYALLSSPLSWTGDSSSFSLVGFSMGGSIVLDFFARHPTLVDSIVLLGPGGLIRKLPAEYMSTWFDYPALVSKTTMRRLLGNVLDVEMSKSDRSRDIGLSEGDFTPAKALQYQFDWHEGHLHSFLSNIQYGPIQYQEATWEAASQTLSKQPECRILVICADDDSVVPPNDVRDDMNKYFPEAFEFKTVPGGHGFPWSEATAVAAYMAEFWGLQSSS